MSNKCPHGYFTHSKYNKCPWCFGWRWNNWDAVPVKGKGNGWLLRKTDPVCQTCGGPATAGGGVLPPGMTHEQHEATKHTIKTCYYCYQDSLAEKKPRQAKTNLGGGHYEGVRYG